MSKYLVVDTETGGFDSEKNALMSMGMILLDEQLDTIATNYVLFKNEKKKEISLRAKEVNGLDEFKMEFGFLPSEFFPVWKLMAGGVDALIGHNISFDVGFLVENGFVCDSQKTLDTMHLSWDVWSGQKASLGKCYSRIGRIPQQAHNALYDCQMVVELLRWFVENGHVKLPLPYYPAVPDFYEKKAFGYKKMKEMNLV